MKITTNLLLALSIFVTISLAQPAQRTFNVMDFEAKGDGKTLNTQAIQRAVDKCAERGGTVVIPPGTFLTGSIELRINVELYVQEGATVLGSAQLSDYAEHKPRLRPYNDLFLKYSLFYAERQSNIAIRGDGVIDGQGGRFKVVSNSNVVVDGPEVPIFIRLENRGREHYEGAPIPPVGATKNVTISDVTAKNVKSTGCSITGIPNHPLEGISLRNIRISFAGGVSVKPSKALKELEDQYPESTMWGQLPAYGFFIRHVKGLGMSDVDLTYEREDARPALVLSDVADAIISGFSPMASPHAEAVIVLEKVNTLMISGSNVKTPTLNLIKLAGERSTGISIIGNDLTNVKNLCDPAAMIEEIIFSSSNRMR